MRTVAVLGVVFGLGLVGCVPLATHKNTSSQLDKAKEANADLVRLYNQAMQRIASLEGAKNTAADSGPMLARLRALEADNDRLKRELAKGPAFSATDVGRIPGSTMERGGISLGSAFLFDEGSARLRAEALASLSGIVGLLKTEYPEDQIIIEGHTDNQELRVTAGTWRHNMRLSSERATAVFEYFLSQGIPEKRMMVRGYSFNQPVNPEKVDSAEGRKENRRVVVRRAGTAI
jgi:outer membrane protein OmpA-like peptidoglycan-associated protein